MPVFSRISFVEYFPLKHTLQTHTQQTWIYLLHLYILTEKTDSQDNSIGRIYIIVLFLQSIQFLFFSLFLFLKISHAFHGLSFIVWPWAIPFRKVLESVTSQKNIHERIIWSQRCPQLSKLVYLFRIYTVIHVIFVIGRFFDYVELSNTI